MDLALVTDRTVQTARVLV